MRRSPTSRRLRRLCLFPLFPTGTNEEGIQSGNSVQRGFRPSQFLGSTQVFPQRSPASGFFLGVTVHLFLHQYGFENRGGDEMESHKAYVLTQLSDSYVTNEPGVREDPHGGEGALQETSRTNWSRPASAHSPDTPSAIGSEQERREVPSDFHPTTPDATPFPMETEYESSRMSQDEMDEHMEALINNIDRARSPEEVNHSLERLRERVWNGRNLPPLPTQEPVAND